MDLPDTVLLIPACLGFISLSRFLLHLLAWIWTAFLRPRKDLRRHYGSWALVTGSTGDIGRALALELASQGLNLVLVDKDVSDLQVVSKQIQQKHGGVEIKTIVIDFVSCRGEEIVRMVEEGTRGLDLGILINNAGLAYPYARFCHEVDMKLAERVVRVNVEGTMWVTRALIPRMLERGRPSAVVNMGSGSSALLPSYPLYTIYAASKAYVAMQSKSISLEYKQQGIDVQCQVPLLVATKMALMKKPSIFAPSAESFSKLSIRCIGSGHQICIPYWVHAVQASCFRLIPEVVTDWYLFRNFLQVRARGLRKDAAGICSPVG